jgi:lipoprotein-anchoring transpeptidase ErfK/SrfK
LIGALELGVIPGHPAREQAFEIRIVPWILGAATLPLGAALTREKMPDYHAILWRALQQGDFRNARWRESVFEQTRQMLRDQLRNARPPLSSIDMRMHSDALEAAIDIIRGELAQDAPPRTEPVRRVQGEPAQNTPPRPEPVRRRPAAAAAANNRYAAPDAPPKAGRIGNVPTLLSIAAAVAFAAVVAGGYTLVSSWQSAPPPKQSKIEPSRLPPPPLPPAPAPAPATTKVEATPQPAAPSLKRPKTDHKAVTLADGDLPPGVDGGSSDADVPFYFRRQPVFYRTTHPVGSIVVDKQQHFLYLVLPNQVALRYGIGVGKSCAGIAGIHKVAAKKEWPEWRPPADMVERKLAPEGVMKGVPGNPLGARIIVLEDAGLSINGTNAPKTIGHHVDFGCVRLVNDDVTDLYNRAAVGARVVFSD